MLLAPRRASGKVSGVPLPAWRAMRPPPVVFTRGASQGENADDADTTRLHQDDGRRRSRPARRGLAPTGVGVLPEPGHPAVRDRIARRGPRWHPGGRRRCPPGTGHGRHPLQRRHQPVPGPDLPGDLRTGPDDTLGLPPDQPPRRWTSGPEAPGRNHRRARGDSRSRSRSGTICRAPTASTVTSSRTTCRFQAPAWATTARRCTCTAASCRGSATAARSTGGIPTAITD